MMLVNAYLVGRPCIEIRAHAHSGRLYKGPALCRRLLTNYRAKLEANYFDSFRPRTLDQATAEQAAQLARLAKGQEQLQTLLLAMALGGNAWHAA